MCSTLGYWRSAQSAVPQEAHNLCHVQSACPVARRRTRPVFCFPSRSPYVVQKQAAILRATSGGIVSLTLLSLLGLPSSRPIASDYAVAPSAAVLQPPDFVGMVGDASGIDDTATFSGIQTVGGTLALWRSNYAADHVPALPGVPTPAASDPPRHPPTDTPPANQTGTTRDA